MSEICVYKCDGCDARYENDSFSLPGGWLEMVIQSRVPCANNVRYQTCSVLCQVKALRRRANELEQTLNTTASGEVIP